MRKYLFYEGITFIKLIECKRQWFDIAPSPEGDPSDLIFIGDSIAVKTVRNQSNIYIAPFIVRASGIAAKYIRTSDPYVVFRQIQ